MARDPYSTPDRSSPSYGGSTSPSQTQRHHPSLIRLPSHSPADSAISFESPRKSWKLATKDSQLSSPPHDWSTRIRRNRSVRRWLLVLLCIGVAAHLWGRPHQTDIPNDWFEAEIPRTSGKLMGTKDRDPAQWLQENSGDRHAVVNEHGRMRKGLTGRWSTRPKAAIISLVRNEELEGIMQSMRQLELHWNHKYRYPWIFFNEKPFSDEFKVLSIIHS